MHTTREPYPHLQGQKDSQNVHEILKSVGEQNTTDIPAKKDRKDPMVLHEERN